MFCPYLFDLKVDCGGVESLGGVEGLGAPVLSQHLQLVGGAVLEVERSGQGEVAGSGVHRDGAPSNRHAPEFVRTLAQAEKKIKIMITLRTLVCLIIGP